MANDIQEAEASKESSTQVILIVDDEETISDFIVGFLEEQTPYRALSALNAVEAIALADVIKPDLLILDYRLPGINGLELFDRLHAMHGLEAVPALMFSANKVPLNVLQERHIPFLMKPFDLNNLLQMIEKLLAR